MATSPRSLPRLIPPRVTNSLKDLFEGMPVVVTPNSQPNLQLNGKIKQLPSPYGTGNSNDTNVHIVLDQAAPAGELKLGDTVTVSVQLANKTGILWFLLRQFVKLVV